MGLYKSTVMTFGLCNTPAMFQTFMDIEFGPLIKEGHVIVYLDDILIYTATITELLYWTHKVSFFFFFLEFSVYTQQVSLQELLTSYTTTLYMCSKGLGPYIVPISLTSLSCLTV